MNHSLAKSHFSAMAMLLIAMMAGCGKPKAPVPGQSARDDAATTLDASASNFEKPASWVRGQGAAETVSVPVIPQAALAPENIGKHHVTLRSKPGEQSYVFSPDSEMGLPQKNAKRGMEERGAQKSFSRPAAFRTTLLGLCVLCVPSRPTSEFGFNLGRFHEAVLEQSSVPVKYLPELVRLKLKANR